MDADAISEKDLESLQPLTFLRGAVIDFYIQYLNCKLSVEERSKCYFFNNWFFTKLCESYTINGGVVSYTDVQKWSKDVDLCEKSYVFIPVNKNPHWSLVIICDLNTSSPYGLHLDSKKGYHDNIHHNIINYFSQVWMARNQTLEYQAIAQLQWIESQVPQQENQSDCGVYLLHYVERFLLQAFTSGNIPSCITKDWFTSAEVASKRMDITNLVLKLRGRSEEPGAAPPGLAVDIMHHGTIAKFSWEYGHDQSEEFKQLQDPVGVDTHLQVGGPSRKRRWNQVNQDGPRRDRSSNWTNEETHVLFRCKREAVLAQGLSQRKNDRTAAWKTISEKIPGKSTVQCQRRWDTLKKSMRDIQDYCLEHNKEYVELQKTDVARMRLATAYDPGWYKYIDEFCNNISKRKSRSKAIDNVTCIVEQEIHSTSPQRGSPHQQSLQISMENPEEKLSSLPVTAPSDCVQFQEGQEVGVSFSLGVSATCELEEQSCMPICLVPSFCLQMLPATSGVFLWEQEDIPRYNNTLSDFTKQILLDILLCSPWSMELQSDDDIYYPTLLFNVSVKELSWWLAIVYGRDALDIMHSLQNFHAMRRGHCECVLAPGHSLDDLESYLEFAFREVQRTPERHKNRLVLFGEHQILTDVCADMAHHEATEVVHLFSCRHLTKLNVRSFINLRSLCVEYCYELRDVSGWENLGNLAWLRWRHSCVDSFPDTRHLTALEFLELDADCAYTSTITSPPDLSQCHQLRSLTLKWYPMLAETPDMTNLKRLQTLRINFCDNIRTIHPSLSALSGLLEVDFSECRQLATLPDLRKLRNLHTLRLSHTQICNIPGVEMLKHLENLECGHSKLSSLPNLGGFAFLMWVDVRGTDIIDTPSVLINPHHVRVMTGSYSYPPRSQQKILDTGRVFDICLGLAEIHDRDSADMMHILQWLCSQSILKGCRYVKSGIQFKSGILSPKDRLCGWSEYESFAWDEAHRRPGWTASRLVIRGERRLERAFEPGAQHEGLRALVLSECKYLVKIKWGGLSNLRYLSIRGCDGVQEVSGWAELKNLAVLEWHCVAWNPSLLNTKHLTSLRHLTIAGDLESVNGRLRGCHWSTVSSRRSFSIDCIHLTSLILVVLVGNLVTVMVEESPNLTQLKHLQRLVIEGGFGRIHSSLSRLTALRHLELTELRHPDGELTDLPSLSMLSRLQVLHLTGWSGFESIPGVEKLVNLRELKCYDSGIAWLPDLNHLAFLEEIDVTGTNIEDKASILCNHNQVKVRGDWDQCPLKENNFVFSSSYSL